MANSGGASENFASKISGTPPWWASAPIWLAAGIVGVPSLLAIGAGWFIASTVSTRLAGLDQASHAQMTLIKEHLNESQRNASIIFKFIDDDLRCQFITCLNSAKTPEQRKACVSPSKREQELGMPTIKK